MKNKFALLLTLPILVSCSSYSYEVPLYQVPPIVYDDVNVIQPLNCFVFLQMYNQKQLNAIENDFKQLIIKVHKNVDSYHYYDNVNNVKVINDNYGKGELVIDEILFNAISKAIEITKLSKGIYNLTLGQVIDVWKNKFDESQIKNNDPTIEEINNSLTSVIPYTQIDNYIKLDKENLTIRFCEYENATIPVSINLGGISKGYALDVSSSTFKKNEPAYINAGSSSIKTIGNHPLSNQKYYVISLLEPQINPNESRTIYNYKMYGGLNLSTSGDYQKCFYSEETGELRSHIFDTYTGYSSNYHRQVSLVSKIDGSILDGLSTIIMNIKEEKDILEMISLFEDYYKEKIAFCYVDSISSISSQKYKLTMNQIYKDNIIEKSISNRVEEIIIL